MSDRARFGGWLLAGASAAAVAGPAAAKAQAWRFHAADVLGTSFELVATAPDRGSALIAADAARAEVARLDAVLSGWREDSELAALNRCGAMAVSPDLWRVLQACERWRQATGGAFDARRGALFALWREAASAGAAPDPAELRMLAAAAAAAPLGLEPDGRVVVVPAGTRVAPEALAKGYVVDRALAAARAAAPAVQGLMLDIGGDLRAWGRGPRGGWVVGVAGGDRAGPDLLIRADARAVATSGAGPRDYRIASARRSHLIGPDGQPAGGARTATVVAPSAADADALATALAVMPVGDGLALVDTLPGVEARVVDDAGRPRVSGGWDDLVLRPTAASSRALIRVADPAAAPWPPGFAVAIDYELPRQGGRAYSPYVAIWVTDDTGRLVRAVTMLGSKLDYVGENYIWWRRYARARPQLVAAISRPTRPAGRYTAVWDGKDDEGRPVGQGRYTVHLEATREDGLHSYQTIELTLGAAAAEAAAPGKDELGVTAVRYGKR